MSHIMHHHIHAIQFGIRLKAFLFSSCLYWSEKKAQKNWKKIKVLISLFPSNWEKKEINFHFLVLKLEEEKEVCNTKHLFTKGTALTSSIEISVHQYSICRHNTQFSHYLEQLNHNLWGEEIVDVLCQSLMLRMLHRFLASGIVGTFSKPVYLHQIPPNHICLCFCCYCWWLWWFSQWLQLGGWRKRKRSETKKWRFLIATIS